MTSRPQVQGNSYGGIPNPDQTHLDRGYGASANPSRTDLNQISSPANLGQDSRTSTAQGGDYTAQHSSAAMEDDAGLNRAASVASTTGPARDSAVSRSNTLKKRSSVSRKNSLKRPSSRKSLRAGSIKGVATGDGSHDPEYNNALHTPIPTHSAPTEVLANRFQAWRTYLKSLITYFREIQTSYDQRSKTILKVSNVISNTHAPSVFISDGGLADATRILNDYHKHALTESNKSRDIESDVIQALNGLRADLAAKIKEIKSLQGDFKNSIDKEKEGTQKAINALGDALQHYDHEDGADKSRTDPFIVRLGVDRQVERQIDEENYLHRAYLNLESSGRELESIVVGEIQKAFNAIAGILRREGDDAYNTVEALRAGPITMQKDMEWNQFVSSDPHFVDPSLPLRRVQDITYPGRDNPAAAEIRAGMLERKSKYLKSYTPGWYVLSPTHLHEFKSADNIYSQPPVMSLHLSDQKLGSHSGPESSSHKFMLKGRQSGGMHRGHSWVFRAESYETMMAWFDAIKSLTETTGAERSAYVRKHARSVSGTSQQRAMSISSDGLEEDEADRIPYAAASMDSQQNLQPTQELKVQRPQPGGRFPSDLNVPRADALSDYSSEPEHEKIGVPAVSRETQARQEPVIPSGTDKYRSNPYELEGVATHNDEPTPTVERQQAWTAVDEAPYHQNTAAPVMQSDRQMAPQQEPYVQKTWSAVDAAPYHQEPLAPTRQSDMPAQQQPWSYEHAAPTSYTSPPQPKDSPNLNTVPTQTFVLPIQTQAPMSQVQPESTPRQVSPIESQPVQSTLRPNPSDQVRHNSMYGDWMGPVAGGAGAAVLGEEAYQHHEQRQQQQQQDTRDFADQGYRQQQDLRDFANSGYQQSQRDAPGSVNEGYQQQQQGTRHFASPGHQQQQQGTRDFANEVPHHPSASSTAGYEPDYLTRDLTSTDSSDYSRGIAPPHSTGKIESTDVRSGNAAHQHGIGGLEGDGAHFTGQLFPRVVRHNTDMSVSALHVPGEFPKSGHESADAISTTPGNRAWEYARE